MEIKRLEGAVEAILFAMGESVELGQIAKAIQQDKPTTEKLLHNLMDKYKDEGRGIQIIELEGSYQLCTKRDYYGCLIRIAMQPKKPALTDVMLETLSIIAYKLDGRSFSALQKNFFAHLVFRVWKSCRLWIR